LAEALEAGAAPAFRPGQRVRVRVDYPAHHFRTPGYVHGKVGEVHAVRGPFRNPESLAHGGDGLPARYLYQVRFSQRDVWQEYKGAQADTVLVDIFEHWLEQAPDDATDL